MRVSTPVRACASAMPAAEADAHPGGLATPGPPEAAEQEAAVTSTLAPHVTLHVEEPALHASTSPTQDRPPSNASGLAGMLAWVRSFGQTSASTSGVTRGSVAGAQANPSTSAPSHLHIDTDTLQASSCPHSQHPLEHCSQPQHSSASTSGMGKERGLSRSSSGSQHVLQRMSTSIRPTCRICLSAESSATDPLISPCACTGTVGSVHTGCLKDWVSEKGSLFCELCHREYSDAFQSALDVHTRCAMERAREAHDRRQERNVLGVDASGTALGEVAPSESCWSLFWAAPWYIKMMYTLVYLCLVGGSFMITTWFVGWPIKPLDTVLRVVFLAIIWFLMLVCFRHIRRSVSFCCCNCGSTPFPDEGLPHARAYPHIVALRASHPNFRG